jgi:transposase
MAPVTIDVDLPPGIAITAYERHGEGHGFEVTWSWPERCRCTCCGREGQARLEVTNRVRVVRDLDVLGQPSFWIYQAVWYRCPHCTHRQDVLPPFKRKDTKYTYRFEQYVLRTLIGSNEEEAARRLGISAETVGLIVRNQLAFMSPRSSTRPSTGSGKKITRAYKAKLTKAQRKEFRSLLWEFRRHPQHLSAKEKTKLEDLFRKLPRLRTLYEIRVRFQIFDTAPDREKAYRSLLRLFVGILDSFPELDPFIRTFETWQEEILNYFDARQTSGPVEGINNKARVIVKRAYGLKSADSLWTRLILDLNRAGDLLLHSIDRIQELVVGFRAIFSPVCT